MGYLHFKETPMAKSKKIKQAVSQLKHLAVEGETYKTHLTQKYLNRKLYEPKNEKKITAFIPGVIVKVLVQPGDAVHPGDKLLVLEAMKMNNYIMAHIEGRIKEVFVDVNSPVAKDALLIELE
jgi:biotin carboxyl carrier protein